MRMIARVFKPGVDLKQAILDLVEEETISAGTVISCVGALTHAQLRMAGAMPNHEDIRDYDGHFEIVAVTGNVGPGRFHLHLVISDSDGKTIGGHMKFGCKVGVTAEVVILADDSQAFLEKYDKEVGFDNLHIAKNR